MLNICRALKTERDGSWKEKETERERNHVL